MGNINRGLFKVLVAFLLNLHPVLAVEAYPILKDGFCPSGYHQSGNYCVPTSDSTGAAIAKDGFCPTGYHASGNYCIANSPSSGRAIIRDGFCPTGFHSSGNYCIEN